MRSRSNSQLNSGESGASNDGVLTTPLAASRSLSGETASASATGTPIKQTIESLMNGLLEIQAQSEGQVSAFEVKRSSFVVQIQALTQENAELNTRLNALKESHQSGLAQVRAEAENNVRIAYEQQCQLQLTQALATQTSLCNTFFEQIDASKSVKFAAAMSLFLLAGAVVTSSLPAYLSLAIGSAACNACFVATGALATGGFISAYKSVSLWREKPLADQYAEHASASLAA